MGDGSVRMLSPRLGGGGRQADFEPRFSGGVKVGSGLVDGSVRMPSGSVDAGATGVTAEVDLTSTDGGGEVIVLRALVHGVRLAGHAPAAWTGSDLPVEEVTIAYERITRAGAPPSSADIAAEVRGSTNSQLFRYDLDMIAEVTTRQRAAYGWAYALRRPGLMAIYDYPGEYAQRFDGIDKGGGE
jgi:hypothetical protein